MPQLYTAAACEKVIIDDIGVASLIGLFSVITINLAAAENAPPPNGAIPKEWAIFTSWEWEPADEGKEYTQVAQILLPDGKPFVDRIETRFILKSGRKQQIKSPIMGFPIGQHGDVTVRLWLEHAGRVVFEARPIRLEVKHVRHNTATRSPQNHDPATA